MNKIFNYCTMLLFAVLTLALGSCTEEYEYTKASVEGQQVYFSNELSTTVNLSETESSFNVSLNRVVTDEALTVNLALTDESGIYSIPSTVTFTEGESVAEITVSYDQSKLEYDVFNSVTIAIADDSYTTPYGQTKYTFSAGLPSPYVSLGTGTFADNVLLNGSYVEAEILQNKNNPNEIRVMHPYDEYAEYFGSGGYTIYPETCPEYLQLYICKQGETLPNGFTATEDNLVYFDEASVGIDIFGLGYRAEIWHPSLLQGGDITHNRVLAWQADGTPGQIQLAPFYIVPETMQGTNQSSTDGAIIITFPGYDPVDYSLDVTYAGAFVSADETSYAIGNVTMGADLDEVQVGVVQGSDVNAALNQVLSGSVEMVTATSSGEVRIPCTYSGDCTMIAIGYAEGAPQNYAAATFSFNLSPSGWRSLGTGLYTDHVFRLFLADQNTGQTAPAITYEVEVQESTETPGLYRLITPYAPGVYGYEGDFGYDSSQSYNIIINACDPEAVYIQGQAIGFYDGSDALMIATLGGLNYDMNYSEFGEETFDLLKQSGYIKGTLNNGVISFPAAELLYSFSSVYYDGMAAYANETEATQVLVLPSAVTASAKAKAAKANKKSTVTLRKNNLGKKAVKEVAKGSKFKIVQKFNPVKKVEYIRK